MSLNIEYRVVSEDGQIGVKEIFYGTDGEMKGWSLGFINAAKEEGSYEALKDLTKNMCDAFNKPILKVEGPWWSKRIIEN